MFRITSWNNLQYTISKNQIYHPPNIFDMVLKTVVISISNKNVKWLLEPSSYMVESGLSKFRINYLDYWLLILKREKGRNLNAKKRIKRKRKQSKNNITYDAPQPLLCHPHPPVSLTTTVPTLLSPSLSISYLQPPSPPLSSSPSNQHIKP